MHCCHKGSHFQASNNSPKSSASPKSSFSGENNENDIRQDKMDSKSQNSKKPLHKHFMSPTVSATSRGVVSGKKVLGDKNESAVSSDVQFQKSPSLDSGSGLVRPATSHPARSYSGVFSASNSTSQFDDDELDTGVGDFSVRPYDPLTNYLSPRPQYLRYKPNRRRQILDRKQCQDRKEDGAFLERSSSFESYNIVENIKPLDCVRDFLNPPSGEGTVTLHNQETVRAENDDDDEEEEEEEEEEDIEEFEEEKRCSLNRVLKFFLLLVVIGLSTSYISSVNSPRMLLMQLQGSKDGCYRVINHSLEAIPTNLCVGNGVIRCMQAGDSQVGFSGVNQHSGYQDLGKVQTAVDDEDSVVVESGDDFVRMLESVNVQNSDICVSGVDKSNIILDHLLNVETAACKDLDIDKVDFDLSGWEIAESIIFDDEMYLIDYSSGENLGVEGAKTDVGTVLEADMGERSQGLQVQEMMQKSDSVSDPKGSGGSSSGKDEVPELENNLVATEVKGNFMENAGEELKDIGVERSAGVTGTMENDAAYYIVEEVEGISEEKPGEDLVTEIVSSESSLMDHDNHEGPDESMPEEAWLKLMKARYMDFGPTVTPCIGFSILAILLASLVYINPARTPSKASQPSRVHFEESKQKEKLIQVKPHGEIECLQKKLESISISLEETGNEFSYNQAPKIDLIGELVIGRESKKNETKESKAISHADSCARSASLAQSSAPDTSSADSASYVSFTAEKKILKKQGARDGSTKMITTPVRRSSRLQNRSIISP